MQILHERYHANLKAIFFIRRNQQIKGVDYFDTFVPIVSWTSVRLLFIMMIHLKLTSKQIDYTYTFLRVSPTYEVYVDMLKGF